MSTALSDRGPTSCLPLAVRKNLDIFACPRCKEPLAASADEAALECGPCKQRYATEGGIPRLFWPNDWDGRSDVTETVKAFYEENPFPSYEDMDTGWTLREKARKGIFARLLDEQLPDDARVAEFGCGTGAVSNFLALTRTRSVFGNDLCGHSLELGTGFARKNNVDNVVFSQMNLFKPAYRPASFDLVICNGVLHHTSEPYLGFKSIAQLVKPGGHIIIGLYNGIGRLFTDFRRVVFNLTGDSFKGLDPRLREQSDRGTDNRRHIWFMDQYKHPHESKHSIGELLGWLDKNGFDYVNGIPHPDGSKFSTDEKLFEPHATGSAMEHFFTELGLLFSPSEGGFYMMWGKKRP
jgi:SAM-dependent methyltransferase